jgi:hypothetical protein
MQKFWLLLALLALFLSVACAHKPAPDAQQATDQQTSTSSSASSASAPALADASASANRPAPAAAVAPAPKPVPAPPKPLVIPAGTVITVRVAQALGSKTSSTGDSFSATVANPVAVEGKTAIPAGSAAQGTVVEAKAKGKVKGEGVLQLALTSVTIKGHTYPIRGEMSSMTAKGKGKRTAVATGGGAGGGALIGGIAGGGKGAAIGAGIGAAAGFLGGTFTGNKQIEVPAESALSFTLSSPVTLK